MTPAPIHLEIPRAALQYQAQLVREVRYVYGMDGPIAAMAGQLMQESGFNANARSPYAVGIAQFVPGTASWLANLRKDLGPAAPLDPGWSIRAMVAYDQLLYKAVRIADSDCDRYLFSLSDYNSGSGWRIGRQARSKKPGSWWMTGYINPGVSQQSQYESENYPLLIVFKWQPIFAAWGTVKGRIC